VAVSLTLALGAFRKAQGKRRKGQLQRLFSAFPGGWPGVGLLLLRVAIGLVAVIQCGFYLTQSAMSTPGIWLGGLLGLAAGGSLLLGFVTPIAGVIVGLGAVGIGFSVFPAPTPNLFDARLSAVFACIMTVAIVFLGPGAFSLDAVLFGRREIIIPQSPRRPGP
jgi:uncharacterized membrane protein YphA (DoxX/SURF4 family)